MPPAATPALAAALAQTRRNQAAAADPAASAWVSANAGTGKTHVLTMRMLRLLLAGTEPARILALTYTKAAAAEMATRVAARLADWVTASDAELEKWLAELLDREPSAAETKRARQLFALVIETPGGLKVQTIHAFCERLLQRFPLEAGVPPGFEILDDHTRAALLEEATNQVLTEATAAAPGAPLAEALATAIAFAAETNFDTYLAEALRQRDWLEAAPATSARILRRPCSSANGSKLRHVWRMTPASDWSRRRSSTAASSAWRRTRASQRTTEQARRRADQGPAHAPADGPGGGLAHRRGRRRADRCGPGGARRRWAHRCTDQGLPDGRRRAAEIAHHQGPRGGIPRRCGHAAVRTGALRRPPRRALQAAADGGDPGAGAARQCRHAALRRGQGAPCPARLRRSDRQGREPPPLVRGRGRGCSTSSTADSTTSWSTRRRIRARCSGR